MEITDEHLEYATVDRLRRMLVTVHEDYKVTHTYALFTTIVCWVTQRIRAQGDAPNDVRARALYEQIALEKAISPQWGLTNEGETPQLALFTFTNHSAVQNLADLPMSDLLVALRNAVAHGDARKITPINDNGWLVGQRFAISAKNIQRQLLWTGQVDLRRVDMRRIGEFLAGRFCASLANARPHLTEEAQMVHEEVAHH